MNFSIKSAIRTSVDIILESSGYLLKLFGYCVGLLFASLMISCALLILICVGLNLVFNIVITRLFVIFLVQILLYLLGGWWLIYIPTIVLFRLHDSEKITISLKNLRALGSLNTIIKLYIATFLYLVLITVGLILLIVPGIFFLIRFQMFGLNIIDNNDGIITSFVHSYKQTQNNFWNFLILTILIIFFFKSLILVPLIILMEIDVYRQIQRNYNVS